MALMIILLAGIALPIALILTAVAIDLFVGIWPLYHFWHDRWWAELAKVTHTRIVTLRWHARMKALRARPCPV